MSFSNEVIQDKHQGRNNGTKVVTGKTKDYSGKRGSETGRAGADKAVKIPLKDNRRQRFLTHEEANILLAALQEKSPILNDMALLSLHSGLRAGEVFSLTWADIDMARKSIFIRDPKSGRNRHAYTTDAVKDILSNRKKEKDSQLVQGIARSFANKHDRTIQLPPARDLAGRCKDS